MHDATIAGTAGGRVRGVRTGATLAFRGIPYASAAGRFAAPGPAPSWQDVRDATRTGPACHQPDRAVGRFTHGEPPDCSEDCLNLNVHTPGLVGERPVMVWLHGGGFATGHAGATLYEGSGLARGADAVVVTVNYRLGSFGWLAHPALAAAGGAPAANWGLLDQIAALRWVRENARAFGGDPDRVTVAGQSAGALCALDLLVAPQADGLFSRLILQSPPLADAAQSPDAALDWAQALSHGAGGAGAFDAAALRELPAATLVTLHEALLQRPEFRGKRGALPTIDPATLPVSPVDAPGARPEVEILIGWTADEGTFFFNSPWRPAPEPERIPGIVAHLTGTTEPERLLDRYRAAADAGRAHDRALLVQVATDVMFADPIESFARARAREADQRGRGGRIFVYRFDHPGGGPGLGATHTSDVPLVFGTWRDNGPGERLGGQDDRGGDVAHEVAGTWGRFLHGQAPEWASFGAASDEVGVFGGAASLHVADVTANSFSI